MPAPARTEGCACQKLDFVELWVGDGLLKDECGSISQDSVRFIVRHREPSATMPSRSSPVSARTIGAGVWELVGSGCLLFVPVMKPADLRDRHDAIIDRRGDRA
jgi:hypothetical protein